jgi:hypothetical protein
MSAAIDSAGDRPVATNRLALRRDARLKLAAPLRMFAFAPRF